MGQLIEGDDAVQGGIAAHVADVYAKCWVREFHLRHACAMLGDYLKLDAKAFVALTTCPRWTGMMVGSGRRSERNWVIWCR